jgi:pimeloyl-ACP methyl ester carboxylesterase
MQVLLLVSGILVLLLLAGAVYQAIGSALDARRYPPPGRLVPVNGHRLHIWCLGDGPSVIFEAPLGGSCLGWALVQPEVAKFARACAYDRAGFGWSDSGPMPRTAQRITDELHTLLEKARIPRPYVFVSHSYGGFVLRLYATQHPEEVAGLVIVDPPSIEEWLAMNAERRRRVIYGPILARYGAWVTRLGVARFAGWLVTSGALGAARATGTVVSGGLLGREPDRLLAPAGKLPAELRPVLRALWAQPKFFTAVGSQIKTVPESAAQVAASGNLGDVPLIVLSAGNLRPERLRENEALAGISSRGKHIVVHDSGHFIQLEQPQVVIDAIREVIEAAHQRPLS